MDDATDIKISTTEKRKYFSFIDVESLPGDQWGYTHFPIAADYMDKYNLNLTMMNGKFHMSWGDFGTLRNQNALEYECFRAVAHGARVCIGDQLHPSGMLDEAVYKRIGNVFGSIECKEPWLVNTKKVCDVGVVIPKSPMDTDPKAGDIVTQGVYLVLSELHIPFDFVNYEDEVDSYKLIILPDEVILTDEMTKKINSYMENGGKVLATGKSGYDFNNNRML